jgi:hypothetical protein
MMLKSRHMNRVDLSGMTGMKSEAIMADLGFAQTSQCRRCLYRLAGTSTCVAFPRGIPIEIIEGHVDHTEPYPGDGGFRFVMSGAFDGARRSGLAGERRGPLKMNSGPIRRALVLALMRAYNDSPPTHTITITREGTVAAGPKGLPFSVWRSSPDERQQKRALTFEDALHVLTDLQGSGAFNPH